VEGLSRMRGVVAFVLVVLLAGCSSPKQAGAPAPPAGAVPASGAPTDVVPSVEGNHTMRFAGGDREAEQAFEDTFQPTDMCIFHEPTLCPTAKSSTHDITAIVASDAPVELKATLSTSAGITVDFEVQDAEVLRYSEDDSGNGQLVIDATLVRSSSGTVSLVLSYETPAFAEPQTYASAVTVGTVVHTITRADVVPAFLPVAVQLGPGDLVNATGDGLRQLVLFPPQGPALRDLTAPFGIVVPPTAPTGLYYLVADADEAINLTGPDRPLQARLLDFVQTTPVDVQANADTTWDMDVPGQPLLVGLQLESKPTGAFFAIAPISGSNTVSVSSPLNVEVLHGEDTCPVSCDFTLLGNTGNGYSSELLEEHLVPGTYHAKVSMQTSNGMQAYSWALSIRQT
jgi:hypothetical protein